MRPVCILIRSTERVAGRGRKDLSSEILKCHDFPVVLNYCFQIQSSLFVEALIEWDEALHRSAGIDARGTDKAWQQLPTHDRSIEQRPKERNLRLLRYRDKEHMILHWVNDDGNVSKGCRDNTPAVVPGVFRPDDVDLIIPQVTELFGERII